MKRRAARFGWSLAMGVASLSGLAVDCGAQQVFERATRVTGPRGRTLERDIRAERGPGYVERDIRIQRPAGTFERQVHINGPLTARGAATSRAVVRGPVTPGFVQRNVIFERPIVVRTIPPIAPGFWGPPIGLYAGSGFWFPPSVIAAPPVTVVYQSPATVIQQVPVTPRVADPFADAMGRLRSHHDNSRRDGALTLGRMGDVRAVPSLMERLDKDHDMEVRVASAWALGELGDPRSMLALDRASRFDKKAEVRAAANRAIGRMAEQNARPVDQPAAPSAHADRAHAAGPLEDLPDLNRRATPPPPLPGPSPESGTNQ